MTTAAAPTIEQLEHTLRVLAYIVVRHGDVYAPLMDRIERELDEARLRSSPRDRAHQILANLAREANRVPAL